eukprot:TRINITY_DN20934_c0_g1_i1.p1 TRINITY_DN20934_c0_g1~~TRINITY_DN20934_c0_g1_i1.p1  ORF type:complete len:485 (-),score=91.02 TRINITY_DN20934_c0_g1_i1:98-1552(-)
MVRLRSGGSEGEQLAAAAPPQEAAAALGVVTSARGSTGAAGRRPLPVPGAPAGTTLEPMPKSHGSRSRPLSAQGDQVQAANPGGSSSIGEKATGARAPLPAPPLSAGRAIAASPPSAAAPPEGCHQGALLPGGAPRQAEVSAVDVALLQRPESPSSPKGEAAAALSRSLSQGLRSRAANDGSQASTAAPPSAGSGASKTKAGAAQAGGSSGSKCPAPAQAQALSGVAITPQRGPGADGDPEGALYGAENLPMVGAAGVLVLPRRHMQNEKTAKKDDDFWGWGQDAECEERVPWRLYDSSERERQFAKYVQQEISVGSSSSAAASGAAEKEVVDMDQVRIATVDQPQSKGSQGPTLLQLAQDPQRREECPVCNAEWREAMRCIAEGRPPPEREPLPTHGGRRHSVKKQKMHSVRCNWAWFQQNLCRALCALRFDQKGAARPCPPSPGSILPPSMLDVWHYWKKAGRNCDRAVASDRLTRGEPSGA